MNVSILGELHEDMVRASRMLPSELSIDHIYRMFRSVHSGQHLVKVRATAL